MPPQKPREDAVEATPEIPPLPQQPNAELQITVETDGDVMKIEEPAVEPTAAEMRREDRAGAAAERESRRDRPVSITDLKDGHCPKCGGEVDRYKGDNPHKQGTYYCPTCGERRMVKA